LMTFQKLHAAHTRGRPQMVHDRISFVESFRGDDVLVSDALVLECGRGAVAMKPNVMFPRNLTEFLIIWHSDYPFLNLRAEVRTLKGGASFQLARIATWPQRSPVAAG